MEIFDRLLESWKPLDLDDIYFPAFNAWIHNIFGVLLMLSTLILPLVIYIILSQSTKEMGSYKYLLIYNLICEYIYDVIVFFLRPGFCFPLTLAYINPYIEMGTTFMYEWLALVLAIIICSQHSMGFLFAHRVGLTFMEGIIPWYFNNKKILIFTNLALVVAMTAAFSCKLAFSGIS